MYEITVYFDGQHYIQARDSKRQRSDHDQNVGNEKLTKGRRAVDNRELSGHTR